MNRSGDWWLQSGRDLQHAKHAVEDRDWEWAAFAAQQAAEKALKAVILDQGGEPWGHLLTALIEALPEACAVTVEVADAGRRLDKHYIPARYPNGFAAGYPGKLYTAQEAKDAVRDAEIIAAFCGCHLSQSR